MFFKNDPSDDTYRSVCVAEILARREREFGGRGLWCH